MEHKKSGKCRLVTAVLTAVMSVTAFVGGGVLLANNLTASAADAETGTGSSDTATREGGQEITGDIGGALTATVYPLNIIGHYELVIEGSGSMTNFTVVSKFGGVTTSDCPWYDGADQIYKVTIGADVSSIGANAFYGCTNLETIAIESTAIAKESDASSFGGMFDKIATTATVVIPSSVNSGYIVSTYGKYDNADGVGSSYVTYICHTHTWSGWQTTDDSPAVPTCTNPVKQYKYCTICNYNHNHDHTDNELNRTTEGDHTYAATWTDQGDGTHAHLCTVCGEADEKTKTAHAWSYSTTVKDGVSGTLKYCVGCGAEEFIPALAINTDEENQNFVGRGAAAYLGTDFSNNYGISFAFMVTETLYQELLALNTDIKVCILVYPTDMLNGGELTTATNNPYKVSVSLSGLQTQTIGENTYYQLTGYMSCGAGLYNTSLTARAYIDVSGVIYYSQPMERTLRSVVEAAYKNEGANRDALLTRYIPAVVEYVDENGEVISYAFPDQAGTYTLPEEVEGKKVASYTIDGTEYAVGATVEVTKNEVTGKATVKVVKVTFAEESASEISEESSEAA